MSYRKLLSVFFVFVSLADGSPRETLCLNGLWDFETTSNTSPLTSYRRSLPVPGSWGESGASCFKITPGELASPRAWQRRRFHAPAAWAQNGSVVLRLEAVVDGHRVLVNGNEVLSSDRLGILEDIDITSALHFGGDNELAVMSSPFRTQPGGAEEKIERSDRGLTRDVWLRHLPSQHVVYAHAISSIRTKTLTVKSQITNQVETAQSIEVNTEVLDNGSVVLRLPPKSVRVPGRGVARVETREAWVDAVPWGFGEYGRPKIYTLRTTLSTGDVRDDRFGFREFRISGEQFLLNEKPIFLKGDLSSRRGIFVENHPYVTAYYQRMRANGLNLQRLHSWYHSTFDDSAWYEVADEVGMLVQAQLHRFATGGQRIPADSPLSFSVWESMIREQFNHPSIISWSIDNESFSVAPKDIPSIPEDKIKAFDRLATFVRQSDPTRVMEIHHNWALFPSVQKGLFAKENFTTFNIHPYGKLDSEVLKAQSLVGFDRSVPTVIGEVYTFPKDLDPITSPMVAYGEQFRKARSYVQQIEDARAVPGVGSIILCALMADGWVGFTNNLDFHLGPWSDFAVIRDSQGTPLGRREFNVAVSWPSLSGPGVKAEFIRGYHLYWAATFGLNLNWFDPTRPIYRENLINQHTRDAFAKLPGGPGSPLGTERSSEVVVVLAPDGIAADGAEIYLVGETGQAQLPGVCADGKGTAWFRVWDTGAYRAVGHFNGKVYEKKFRLSQRPRLDDRAGYGHLQWVSLTGGDVSTLPNALTRGPTFPDAYDLIKGDVVANGGMEAWQENGVLLWNGPATPSEKRHRGNWAAQLNGPKGRITTPLKMEKGRSYTLSGWVFSPDGNARLRITDQKYGAMVSLTPMANDAWQILQTNFTAPGPGYLYAEVTGNGSLGVFDDLQVIAGPEIEPPALFDPGPFAVSGGGFIRHWLRLGPFPSRALPDGSFEGHITDFLSAHGGEPNYRPVFGKTVDATFPPGAYWKSGTTPLSWKFLESGGDLVRLNSIGLPARGISDQDPSGVCAYLAATVVCPQDRQAEIAIGSDDGYRIWLEGKEVGALSTTRGAKIDQEHYPVSLKQGSNALLVKIFQDTGGWNCYLRFKEPSGNVCTDLEITLPGEARGPRCLSPEGGLRPVFLSGGRSLFYEVPDDKGVSHIKWRDLPSGRTRDLGEGGEPIGLGDGTILFRRPSPSGDVLVAFHPADGHQKIIADLQPTVTGICGALGNGHALVATPKGLYDLGPSHTLSPWAPGKGAVGGAVSPNGALAALVAFDSGSTPVIRLVHLESGREIFPPREMKAVAAGRVGGCHSPAFSPDGKTLVFIRSGIQPYADVWAMDLSSGRETAITFDGARNSHPTFSPDGKRIVFSATREGDREKIWALPYQP